MLHTPTQTHAVWKELICNRCYTCCCNPHTGLTSWRFFCLPLCMCASLSLSVSACLLTKELPFCLSGRIVLSGDFLCNHLIIHQFPKKPQRGCTSTLCWRAQQWETEGGVSWKENKFHTLRQIKVTWPRFYLYSYVFHSVLCVLPPQFFPFPLLSLTEHYNDRQPRLGVDAEFWQTVRPGASASLHLHRALQKLK